MAESSSGNEPGMLRKVLWLALSAGAVFAARRAAAKAWHVATGEPPPGKKA